MFKKLRNRFLLLNMVIISVLMLISFTSIYLITYNDVYSGIHMELIKASEARQRNDKRLEPGFQEGKPNIGTIPGEDRPIPEFDNGPRSVSFTLVTDSTGEIQEIESFLDMEDTFYQNAKASALALNKETGTIKVEEGTWTFLIRPLTDGNHLTFVETSSRLAILSNLIMTFGIVALVMFIFIYFISRFFAERSIKPIKEAFDKQKQFIADSSHELKTPLAVINTNLDVLMANGENTVNSQAKWLHYIKSEADRMTKLTHDLLYLTQVDDTEMKLIFSDFNLSETVSHTVLPMEAVIFEKGISEEEEIEENLWVRGNSEQMQQVLMILLDNAVKYTPSSGSIKITLKRQAHHAILSVSNTGEGIPQEHLSRIFDRFYRTDKSRARFSGGYGLGLAIAKAIVERHGGEIKVKSALNELTTFSVELPLIA